MKIAIIAPIHTPVLPDYPGGIEVFNYAISSELFKRGHDVTLYAAGDSKTKAKLYQVCDKSLFNSGLDPNDPAQMRRIIYYETNYLIKAMEQIKNQNYDIVHHNHTMIMPIYLTKLFKIPQVLTLHLASSDVAMSKGLEMIFPEQKEIPVISISYKQRQLLPAIKFYENIYNGIDLDNFEFNDRTDNYLAWMGRFVKNKGPEEAMQVASLTKRNLKMAGKVDIGNEKKYFDQLNEKYLKKNNLIKFIGPADKAKRNELLKNARAFLMPINWEEPFGLVMIEAMACGTPVIAFNRGAVSEIIKDKETGFICPPDDIRAMSKAVEQLFKISKSDYQKMRTACRKRVEEFFSIQKMVDNYEKIYQKIIKELK